VSRQKNRANYTLPLVFLNSNGYLSELNSNNMSAAELKQDIIKRISAIDDAAILEEIRQIVRFEQETETVVMVSTEERQAIDQGLEDIKAGRVYSSEEAEKLLRGWLEK
jgi:predicted transcriptional regulator